MNHGRDMCIYQEKIQLTHLNISSGHARRRVLLFFYAYCKKNGFSLMSCCLVSSSHLEGSLSCKLPSEQMLTL